MGAVLFVGFDASPALAKLGRLRAGGQDMSPVMADISLVVLSQVDQAFDTETAPDGRAWKPLKGREGKMLQDSGFLKGSVFKDSGPDFAEVGASAIYAAAHQFGTWPRVLKPVKAKALFWPGAKHPVGKVFHPGIPSRRFIPDEQSLDWKEIDIIVTQYLEGLLWGAFE